MDENNIDVDKLPNDDQVFGRVTSMLGANKVRARCLDGEERLCRIPGSMQKNVWIREDDIVIVEPWDWQDEKADIVHRYEEKEKEELENEISDIN